MIKLAFIYIAILKRHSTIVKDFGKEPSILMEAATLFLTGGARNDNFSQTFHMLNKFAGLVFCLAAMGMRSNGQEPRLQGQQQELFAGPVDASARAQWLDTLVRWRTNEKKLLQFNDSEYKRPGLAWAKNIFGFAQVMAHDRYLYDPVARKYTVERYVNDLNKRYGGVDAILFWPTYPNIGVDNSNQFDIMANLPGGKEGIRKMINDFHRMGIKVFLPIMIWDRGTRPINTTMARALISEVKALGFDGLNGDTMYGVTEDFKNEYTGQQYPVALQPELRFKDLKMVEWNIMSWGYFWESSDSTFSRIPGVSIYKWLEPRHQVHLTDRWMIDKTIDLQLAFFNGIGLNSWENVWGIWNEMTVRHSETLRRINNIYHRFSDHWSNASWEPHVPVMQQGVFASRFPGSYGTVFTLINRDSTAKSGTQLRLRHHSDDHYYDLWNGREIMPEISRDSADLSLPLEAMGYGALLVSAGKKNIRSFLDSMKAWSTVPLLSLPDTLAPLKQQQIRIDPTGKKPDTTGMVYAPREHAYRFETMGVMIEGDELPSSVGVQYPWEGHPQRNHSKTLDVPAFYIDKYPVTNRQFKKFMDATHYHPADDHNFLKDWKTGSFPAGWENKPVTWVSLDDARSYAAWAGKRLPHEWEWQYAAQGQDQRPYPWGNNADPNLVPVPDTTRLLTHPSDVTAFPGAASPFGVLGLTGNVWQWTDEYVDEHTRAAILKGGSYYQAKTSGWYFPQAQELNKYAKYLLLSPGMDRAATIGFRCVADEVK